MNNFRLLAIRPLVDCHTNFLKNLTPGLIYKLCHTYDYYDKDDNLIDTQNHSYLKEDRVLNTEVKKIENRYSAEEFLFDIKNDNGHNINMNVAAIVGKNGSGKSALLELLYAMCYTIALRKGIIKDHNEHAKYINKKNIDKNKLQQKINDIQFFLDDFQAEIFYEVNGGIYGIRWANYHLTHHFLGGENNRSSDFTDGIYIEEPVVERIKQFLLNELLFYTISINYSLYGLNTNSNNRWLQDLFHKNDGYQTPLVINPFRKKGNIDVNTELHLAQTRLLSNIFKTGSEEWKLVNEKVVNLIAFELNYKNFETFGNISLDNVIETFKRDYRISDQEFFKKVYNTFYDKHPLNKFDLTSVKNNEILIKYLYRKIFKVAMNYEEYREYIKFPKQGKPIPKINGFFDHLSELKRDRSHITLKLCQILNIIRYNFFEEDEQHQWQIGEVDPNDSKDRKLEPPQYFALSFNDLIQRIQRIYKGNEAYRLEEFIPTACVIPRLAVQTGMDTSNFEVMSSGEQHFVHSMQSIFYHLKNLDSVFSTEKDKIKYRYVNLALDEIELYFHPEFQRNYIYELRKGIKQLGLKHIQGINVLLSTHSPFILSDIPHTNILRMEEGKPRGFDEEERTFGQNIHDLLKNDFFLETSFMGEQARNTIQSLIKFLKDTKDSQENPDKWNDKNAINCIKLIGEPLLRNSLRDLYLAKFNNEEEIDKEIKRLQNLKKKQ